MVDNGPSLSTGLSYLDSVLRGMIAQDSIVWRINPIDEYLPFMRPYCDFTEESGTRLIDFRSAKHPSLISPSSGTSIPSTPPGRSPTDLLPDADPWAFVVGLLEPLAWKEDENLRLNAGAPRHRVVGYWHWSARSRLLSTEHHKEVSRHVEFVRKLR